MDEYNDYTLNLKGISLSYYKFFQQFTVTRTYTFECLNNLSGTLTLAWNGVILGTMGFTNQLVSQVPTCNHIREDPTTVCTWCNAAPFPSTQTESKTYIRDLEEFIHDQMTWAQSAQTQESIRQNSKNHHAECQRRISFFLLKLHEGFSSPGIMVKGVQITNSQGIQPQHTLRDIRSMSKICLQY